MADGLPVVLWLVSLCPLGVSWHRVDDWRPMSSELNPVSSAARGRVWRSVLLVVGVVLGGAVVVPGALPVAALAGSWNDAVDVPELKVLNTNGFAEGLRCRVRRRVSAPPPASTAMLTGFGVCGVADGGCVGLCAHARVKLPRVAH